MASRKQQTRPRLGTAEHEDDEDADYVVRITWNGHDLRRYCESILTFGEHGVPAPFVVVELNTPSELLNAAHVSRGALLETDVTVNGQAYQVVQETGTGSVHSANKHTRFTLLLVPQTLKN